MHDPAKQKDQTETAPAIALSTACLIMVFRHNEQVRLSTRSGGRLGSATRMAGSCSPYIRCRIEA